MTSHNGELSGALAFAESFHILPQHRSHPRDWQSNLYVYPVISRRSRGLSIGINLNPDGACNFDCVYCQVDRSKPPKVREVDVDVLQGELVALIELATSGELFDSPAFANVPKELQAIRDIAFSGDGEPTTCPCFLDAVDLVVKTKHATKLTDTRIVLITDAAYLTKPKVEAALVLLDENNGEVWAKLDAGTQAYYQTINQPNVSLKHVLGNIMATSQKRPIVIQSLFMQIDGQGPDQAELEAYVDRLCEIRDAGGQVTCVQIYTIARLPAQSNVSALSDSNVDDITSLVKTRTGFPTASFYGAS